MSETPWISWRDMRLADGSRGLIAVDCVDDTMVPWPADGANVFLTDFVVWAKWSVIRRGGGRPDEYPVFKRPEKVWRVALLEGRPFERDRGAAVEQDRGDDDWRRPAVCEYKPRVAAVAPQRLEIDLGAAGEGVHRSSPLAADTVIRDGDVIGDVGRAEGAEIGGELSDSVKSQAFGHGVSSLFRRLRAALIGRLREGGSPRNREVGR